MTTATQIDAQQYRTYGLERNQAPDSDTLEFSFSSDEPFDRWWGTEVLDHSPEAVDLSRLNDGGVFLWNHNMDVVLGSLQKAWLDGNKGRCEIRWAKTEEALKYRGLVEDGHLKNISVGYQIHDIKSLPKDTYRVTRWEPLEVSLVSVPADNSVGVGRSQDLPTAITIKETRSVDTTLTPPVTDPSPELLEKLRKQERERQTLIQKLGQHFNLPSDFQERLANSDYTPEQVKSEVLDFAAKKTSQPVASPSEPLGLTKKEQRQYSVLKAINAVVSKNWQNAGFEKECHEEIAKRSGKTSGGVFVPVGDLLFPQQRIQQVAQPTLGGNLVETVLDEARFIDILRNQLAIAQMGATMLTGLVGNLDIPRQTGASTAYWVGEGDQITDSSLAFDLVELRLKTVAGIVGATRNMLLQTSLSAETLIRQDLVQVLALEIDRAALYGSGTSNQPLGIANQPGIQSVVFGTDGGPVSWAKVVEFEQKLDTANALMGGLGYLSNPRVRAALKTTEKATGTAQFLLAEPGNTLNGYRFGVSNQVRGNRSKGSGTNLSDIFYGNWADLLMGEWGVLELLPNEFGAGYRMGIIEIRAMQSIDIAVRRAISFVLATDVSAA